MATEKTMTGRCLCGAVTFEARDVNPEHHVCHCDACRRWCGSPFFGIDNGGVTWSGEESILRYDSSEWAQRGSCSVCGSSLFYSVKQTGKYSISAGLFDDQEKFRLANEIFIDRKPPGYEFAGDLPKMTEAEVIEKYFPPGD
jgi:hypothetical protein